MYSELAEDINGSTSFDASVVTLDTADHANGTKHRIKGGIKTIQKSSDLRKSLMEDDLESGVVEQPSPIQQKSFSKGHNDPYYVFKEDLLTKLDLVKESLKQYEYIVMNTDTSVNKAQVKDVKKQLKRHIKNAESTLRDVQTTIRMVEKSRAKFLEINDEELFDRKHFTETCKNRINGAKDNMNSQSIKTKMLKDQRSLTKRRLGLANTASLEDNEDLKFIENTHASAQLMMEQQEDTLDELDGAVVRVSHMAENIHEELGHQNKMLNELEDDLQNAEEQLGLVMGKLAKVLKTKSRCQLGTIVMLSVIVVVLLFLVIYT